MSECVVRMEMPECCDECPMEYDGFMCGAIRKRFYPKKDGCYLDPLIDPSKERLPDCPIICALPDGHGRLVDADALADDVRSLWDYKTVDGITASTVLKQIMTDIGNCPTIVPAERRLKCSD